MRRLIIRYERRDDIYDAFFRLGCCLICFNFLAPVLRRKLTAVERKQSSWAPQWLSTMVPSRRKAYNGSKADIRPEMLLFWVDSGHPRPG